MAKKPLTVETPGTAREPEVDTPASLAKKDNALKSQVAAIAADIANGSKDAVDWSHLNQAAAAAGAGQVVTEPALPDESDVDPAKIREPVLSRQGWVMPADDPRSRIGLR